MKINRSSLVLIVMLCFVIGCAEQNHDDEVQYFDHVGDSAFDSSIDDVKFELCHDDFVVQYYNFSSSIQYEGEKYAILEAFNIGFKKKRIEGQTGYITIRFIVNCEGQTGRFRIEQIDTDYKYKEFDQEIVGQLVAVTKSLKGWKKGILDDRVYDYYQYLTFKLENGIITKIAP